MNTITAGDYSIEFDIAPEFYKKYQETKMVEWEKESFLEDRMYLSKVVGF